MPASFEENIYIVTFANEKDVYTSFLKAYSWKEGWSEGEV